MESCSVYGELGDFIWAVIDMDIKSGGILVPCDDRKSQVFIRWLNY